MKVAFVQSLPVMLESYLALSASLKGGGVESEVFIDAFEKDLIFKIIESEADLIGFNCLTGSYNWALAVTRKLKKIKNIPVVLGGCHPTYYPETIDFDSFDYICIGEGEGALIELTEKIRDDKDPETVSNIGMRKNNKLKINAPRSLVKDINTLPFYNRRIYHKYNYFHNMPVYKYRTSRSCPYRCSFCFTRNQAELYSGQNIFRTYSVDYIIEELQCIKKDYKNLRAIFFSDEIFGLDKKWAHDLLALFKNKINLPYTITTRADLIDKDFVKLLKSTNCDLVSISIETANEKLRREVLNKDISNQTVIDAGKLLYDAGIKTRVNCIFCLPGETLHDAFENIKLMKQMKAFDPVGFLLQPYPKTAIHRYAVENGCLKEGRIFDELDPLVYFKTPINLPDKKKIIVVQRLFAYACRVPFFDRLLRILVNIPNNILFDTMQKAGIALSHKHFYGLSWYVLIRYLLSARRLDMKELS